MNCGGDFYFYFCREIMHAMWKPQKFKYIYLYATLYVFTLTIPSATSVYWAFGDELLNHANAFSLLPKNGWRDAAVILMLIHQVRPQSFHTLNSSEKMISAHACSLQSFGFNSKAGKRRVRGYKKGVRKQLALH